MSAQYFGGDLRTCRSAAGLRFSEVDYGSSRKWTPHTHWRAFFALLLRGRYVESFGSGRIDLAYEPFDLGFHPEAMQHADRIAADGTRFLLIELDETWVRRLRECSPEAASQPQMCRGAATTLALRAYRELRAAGVSPSAEGLVLELLAGLLPRTPERTAPSWIATVLEWIDTEYPSRLALTEIARQLRLHPVYVSRAFRTHTGQTVSERLAQARLRYAARRLAEPGAALADIAVDAGFADQSHFTKVFKRETGMTPGDYRAAGDSACDRMKSAADAIACATFSASVRPERAGGLKE